MRALILLFAFLFSCAGEPGQGWGELSGIFEVAVEDLEWRTADDGAVTTSSGHHVYVDELTLEIEEVVVAGKDAEEATIPLVQIAVQDEIDLIGGASVAISEETCRPDCVLEDRHVIREIEVHFLHLHGKGTVTDGTAQAAGVPWTVDIDLSGTVVHHEVAVAVGHESEPVLHTDMELHIPASIFDEVEWDAFAKGASSTAAVHLAEHIAAQSELHVEIEGGAPAAHEEGEAQEEADDGHGH